MFRMGWRNVDPVYRVGVDVHKKKVIYFGCRIILYIARAVYQLGSQGVAP